MSWTSCRRSLSLTAAAALVLGDPPRRAIRPTHRAAPQDPVRGRFLGDYTGIVAMPGGFGAAFTQSQPKAKTGGSDVFFARTRIPSADQ